MATAQRGNDEFATAAAVTRSGLDTASSSSAVSTTVALSGGVRMPTFAGSPTDDFDDWVDAAQDALAAAGIDTTKPAAARAVATGLLGAARDAYLTLDETGRSSLKGVIDGLREFFGPVDVSAAARAKLYAFRRGALSLPEYAARLRRLCRRVNVDMPEADVVQYFLRGLDRLTMEAVLALSDTPDTFAAALKAAKRFDHAANTAAAAAAPLPSPLVAAVQPVVQPTVRPTQRELQLQRDNDTLRTRLEQLELAVSSFTSPIPVGRPAQPRQGAPAAVQMAAATPASQRPLRSRDPTRDRWTAEGVIICNACHRAGHKASECDQRTPRSGPF